MSERTTSIIFYFYFMYIFICIISIYVLVKTYDKWSFPIILIPIGVFCLMFGMLLFEYKTKKVTRLVGSLWEETK